LPETAGAGARPSPALVVGALAVIYVVWGSVYLAIRLVVNESDPFASMTQRFFAAGALMVAIVVARGGWRRLLVTRRQAGVVLLTGILLLAVGNGFQALGQEQGVASGVAALIVAGVPLWVAILRTAGGDRPHALTFAGIALGLVGLFVLVLLGRGAGVGYPLLGLLSVTTASVGWAIGSYLMGKLDVPRDIFVVSTYQQLVAGCSSVVLALLRGEQFTVDYSTRGWAAMVYLVVVCSVMAFSVYAWLVTHTSLSLVATHAYVNPVVAVLLGWLVLAEPIGAAVLVGGGIVVASVAVVVTASRLEQRVTDGADPANALKVPSGHSLG
jgi:drug/metabolite transporter (DMT)-like permease